ncbi:MAG TPA: SDR family NAD(P)-dependent oxidoreductase [Longimicrobiales bacterium]|nr:SDR family NAD(P)-dependent oxidoreductase [Longimicrobiales bacterium]
MPDLTDRVALVTGASRGIGAGLARAFHARGLKLALCARSEPGAGELPSDPHRIHYGRVDVTDPDALERFAAEAEERLGPIDLWVNNAGLLEPIALLREADPAAVRRHVEVNVLGVFHGMRIHLARLHETGRTGTVVNISSGAAQMPYEGWGAYCAGKAAVDMLTRVAAREERAYGNRVYALAPGVVATGMQALIRRQSQHDFPAVERFRELHAAGKLLDAESPAPAVLRLAFGSPLPEDAVVLDVRGSPELRDLEGFAD